MVITNLMSIRESWVSKCLTQTSGTSSKVAGNARMLQKIYTPFNIFLIEHYSEVIHSPNICRIVYSVCILQNNCVTKILKMELISGSHVLSHFISFAQQGMCKIPFNVLHIYLQRIQKFFILLIQRNRKVICDTGNVPPR